jgi:hypothetical protein
MLNERHFVKFANEFYGYGDWSTKDWFLGIEEGGGANINHVIEKFERFYYWTNVKDGLVDNYEFQSGLEECKIARFLTTCNGGPIAQTTWLPLLKSLLLSKTGIWPTLIDAKMAQIINLGRQYSSEINSTWIELFPLPNPGVVQYERWHKWTDHFQNPLWNMPRERTNYESIFIGDRIDFIKKKLEENKPRNLVAYIGTNPKYTNYLERIIGVEHFTGWAVSHPLNNKNILYSDIVWNPNQISRIFRCYQPSRTSDRDYWEAVGELMI